MTFATNSKHYKRRNERHKTICSTSVMLQFMCTHAYRNPEHHQRPSFEEICTYLQQPINKLINSESQKHDIVSATEDESAPLGADLDTAMHLYLDLQGTYTSS